MLEEVAEKIEEEVLDKVRTPEEELTEAEAPCWNGGVYEEAGGTEYVRVAPEVPHCICTAVSDHSFE